MNEFDDLNLEEAQEMDETPETRDLARESDAEDLPEETGLPSPEETELPEPEDLLEDRPALRELTDEEREALAIPPAERTWHQTELADLARHGDFETQKSFLRDENGDLAEAKDYGDVNNLLRNMEAQTADRLALFGSDVDITYSVNGSRLSVGDAERLQEKAEELGVSAELILK